MLGSAAGDTSAGHGTVQHDRCHKTHQHRQERLRYAHRSHVVHIHDALEHFHIAEFEGGAASDASLLATYCMHVSCAAASQALRNTPARTLFTSAQMRSVSRATAAAAAVTSASLVTSH